MKQHTSKRLSLERNPPSCWCTHPEENHAVRWLENQGEFAGLELGIWYPEVGCETCLEQQLNASRLQTGHNLQIARALAQAKPEAALVVQMLELTERIFTRRAAGAPDAEIDELIREHQQVFENAKELVTFQQLSDKGNA